MCFSSLLISCTVIKATPLNISALKIFSIKAPIELLMLIFCIFKWLSPSSIPKHECQSLVCCDLTLTSVAAVSSYGTERQRLQISASTSQVTVWILKRHCLKKRERKGPAKRFLVNEDTSYTSVMVWYHEYNLNLLPSQGILKLCRPDCVHKISF